MQTLIPTLYRPKHKTHIKHTEKPKHTYRITLIPPTPQHTHTHTHTRLKRSITKVMTHIRTYHTQHVW